MMPEVTKEIMELLKKNFLRADENYRKMHNKEKRNVKFQCDRNEGAYYLFSLADNLYKPMSDKTLLAYGSGSGNEIFSGKMNALRSSSALTYNLFGNGDAKIINKPKGSQISQGTYTVEFEKQFHTLKPSVSRFPANLDAFLYCEETKEAIACEMKMLEWLSKPTGKLKNAYFEPKNYIGDGNPGKEFTKIAEKLVKGTTPDHEGYPPGKDKRYDAFQMFKHAVACYTACATSEEKRKIKKLTLLNCIWTLPKSNVLSDKAKKGYEEAFNAERSEADAFITLMNPVKDLFKGIEFNIEFCEFRDLLSRLDKTEDELAYLKRYTFDFTEENK